MGSSPPHAESRDGADLLSLRRESYIWTLNSFTAGSVLAVSWNKEKKRSPHSLQMLSWLGDALQTRV